MNIRQHRLNIVLQLNLLCLLLHIALYGGISNTLTALNNPFADLIVMLSIVSLIGLWLCFDFMMPVLADAVRTRQKSVARPVGWMMMFTAFALVGGANQLMSLSV